MRAGTGAVILWCAVTTAPGPAGSRLPDAVTRAVDGVSETTVRHYVETLASDAFAGRGVGHEGNRAAEQFIATSLRACDVPPAANGSYFQPVQIFSPRLGAGAHLLVSQADGQRIADLRVGADFYPLPETGDAPATGPLVSAGYGITDAAGGRRYDDYAQVDARGAIVLALEGAPRRLPTAANANDDDLDGVGTLERKISDAEAHGARGLIVVRDYLSDPPSVWPEHPSVRDSDYRLASDLRAHPAPLAAISARAARPIRAALAGHARLTASLTPDLVASPIEVHNVLGWIEGRDPEARGTMVVVGAHLDHDGLDGDGHIYNGADDNASGTAAVIAAACAFASAAASGERPSRGVLFALWNGEEKGELGAESFVADPEPARRIVANINLDMVGRHENIPDPDDWRFHGFPRVSDRASANTLHLLGYSYSGQLADEVLDANTAVGLDIREDYDHGAQGLLHRSDDWPFLAHGIPAVFLTTGLHPDYHTPEDDADKIDYPKLTRVARLAARAAWMVAERPPPALQPAR